MVIEIDFKNVVMKIKDVIVETLRTISDILSEIIGPTFDGKGRLI